MNQAPELEKYEIISTLGEGGMGTVYLAKHRRIDRYVAIKMLHANLARNPLIRERFKNEAALLAKLSHPNIVTLYDYEEHPHGLYLIMEYVKGIDLASYLKQHGPIPFAEARNYMNQILDAFGYAHKMGIIHRDIKPSNIVITEEKKIKILDFGIAKITTDPNASQLTRPGARIGTLMYMSPEQVKGEEPTIQSDIYALGITFFQMLTAAYPYDPSKLSEYEISVKIVQENLLEDPYHPYSKVPETLREALAKAIAKDPKERYESCEAFRNALENAFNALNYTEDFTLTMETPTESSASLNTTELVSILSGVLEEEKENSVPTPTQLLETQTLEKKKIIQKRLWVFGGLGLIVVVLMGMLLYWQLSLKKARSSENPLERIRGKIPTLEVVVPSSNEEAEALEQPPEETMAYVEHPIQRATLEKKQEENTTTQETQQNTEEQTTTEEEDYTQFKKYLQLAAPEPKKGLARQWRSNIMIANSAMKAYHRIKVEIRYFNKKGKQIGASQHPIPGEVPPKGSLRYELRYKVPKGTASVSISIANAEVKE